MFDRLNYYTSPIVIYRIHIEETFDWTLLLHIHENRICILYALHDSRRLQPDFSSSSFEKRR